MSWLNELKYDPIKPLLTSEHTAITYWTKKDLMSQPVAEPKVELWDLKIPDSILRKQNTDGSWTYPSKKVTQTVDYNQVETYRQLGFLIEMFGFSREHSSIKSAAEFIFSKQSEEGDIRGIYANQYSPNYTAAFIELLVKAGYENDARVLRAFSWLDSVRQSDGGWALTFRTNGRNLDTIYQKSKRLELNRDKPFSHLITGVVLRAYVAHPKYRNSEPAKAATKLLVPRFFEHDVYPDKNRKDDWLRFSFPFWQTDILSSLDIVGLTALELSSHPKVIRAKEWFTEHQQADGLFTGHLLKDRYHDLQLWYSYAICRAFDRFK